MPSPNGLNPTFDTASFKRPVVTVTASTLAITAGQSNSVFLLGVATGTTITLPAPVPGTTFDFIVTVPVTSNSYKIITSGSAFLMGFVSVLNEASSNAGTTYLADGTTIVSVNMNGGTTGGLAGNIFSIRCVTSTLWTISGNLAGTGTLATPLATS